MGQLRGAYSVSWSYLRIILCWGALIFDTEISNHCTLGLHISTIWKEAVQWACWVVPQFAHVICEPQRFTPYSHLSPKNRVFNTVLRSGQIFDRVSGYLHVQVCFIRDELFIIHILPLSSSHRTNDLSQHTNPYFWGNTVNHPLTRVCLPMSWLQYRVEASDTIA